MARRRCTRCGIEWKSPLRVCRACRVELRILELLSIDGVVADRWRQLRSSILARGVSAAEQWLNHNRGPSLLRKVVLGEIACTHGAFDLLPQSQTTRFLRALLVANGLLPTWDPELHRLQRWLYDVMEYVAQRDRAIISQYSRWAVLRTLSARERAEPLTRGSAAYARCKVRWAIDLLASLCEQGLRLVDCQQSDVDAWISTRRAARAHIGPFLRWAQKRKLIGEVRARKKDVQARSTVT